MKKIYKMRKSIEKSIFRHPVEVTKNQFKQNSNLNFTMVSKTKIWVYKNLNVVADIYINEENHNKIYAEVDINPYSNINFQLVDKEFRSFLYDNWTRKQYNKLETIELFSKKYFDN